MEHSTARATILPEIISLIITECGLNEVEALDAFYWSATGAAFSDDNSGLYGQSPNYIFGLYMQEMNEKNCK